MLRKHVDFVIGCEGEVLDATAVAFAKSLYNAMGQGLSLLESFKLAKTVKEDCSMYCLRGRTDAGKFCLTPDDREVRLADAQQYVMIDADGKEVEDPDDPEEARLGSGAFAETFRVMHSIDKHRLAVKEIRLSKAGKHVDIKQIEGEAHTCLLYTSPSPRDKRQSRMPSSA